jgi:hypothetical protein
LIDGIQKSPGQVISQKRCQSRPDS